MAKFHATFVHCLSFVFFSLSVETLPYLFQALFVLDEGLAPLILQLIYSALSGTPPTKEEGSGAADGEGSGGGSRTQLGGASSSRGVRRKETDEHKKNKEKSKEKEAKVTVVGKSSNLSTGMDTLVLLELHIFIVEVLISYVLKKSIPQHLNFVRFITEGLLFKYYI